MEKNRNIENRKDSMGENTNRLSTYLKKKFRKTNREEDLVTPKEAK